MTRSSPSKRMPRTPTEERPVNTRTSPTWKRIALPLRVASKTSFASVQVATAISRSSASSPSNFIAILPLARTSPKSLKRVAPDIAVGGREHDGQVGPALLVLGQRHDRRDRLAGHQVGQQVDHRPAARLGRAERQAVDLELVDPAGRGKEQHRRMGRGDKHLAQEIFLADRHAGAAAAAAALRPVGRQRHPLDVAGVADGDDHRLALDQGLDIGLELDILDLGAARGWRSARGSPAIRRATLRSAARASRRISR